MYIWEEFMWQLSEILQLVEKKCQQGINLRRWRGRKKEAGILKKTTLEIETNGPLAIKMYSQTVGSAVRGRLEARICCIYVERVMEILTRTTQKPI